MWLPHAAHPHSQGRDQDKLDDTSNAGADVQRQRQHRHDEHRLMSADRREWLGGSGRRGNLQAWHAAKGSALASPSAAGFSR